MKKIIFILFVSFFVISCTSKTIYPKPSDLISKDSMSLLIEDLIIAGSAKNTKNITFRRKINYHPLVFEKYKIDSARFERSNFYYTSKIDAYEDIFSEVVSSLEKKHSYFFKIKKVKDSIYRDSVKRRRDELMKLRKKEKLKMKKEQPKIGAIKSKKN